MTLVLTKIAASQNEVALRYYKVRGLYFLADIFEPTIVNIRFPKSTHECLFVPLINMISMIINNQQVNMSGYAGI